VEDLKGLKIVNPEGKVLGQLVNISEGGNGSLAELLLLSGKRQLTPFRKEFYGDPDFKEGTIVLLEPWILDGS